MKYNYGEDVLAEEGAATTLPSSGTLGADLKRASEVQALIVKTYLEEDAPLEVNISAPQRRACVERLDPESPVEDLFDEAAKECEKLAHQNLFGKFMKQAAASLVDRVAFEAQPPPPRPSSVVVRSRSARPPSGPPPDEDVPVPKAVVRKAT